MRSTRLPPVARGDRCSWRGLVAVAGPAAAWARRGADVRVAGGGGGERWSRRCARATTRRSWRSWAPTGQVPRLVRRSRRRPRAGRALRPRLRRGRTARRRAAASRADRRARTTSRSPSRIVPDGPRWRFDTAAGQGGDRQSPDRAERARHDPGLPRLRRRAARVLRAARGRATLQQYAQPLASTPGKRDGLYWDASRASRRARSARWSRERGPRAMAAGARADPRRITATSTGS